VALVRLDASFSAAQVLLRCGFYFEACAVIRLILEQLAWVAAVADLSVMSEIENTKPSASIRALKRFMPCAGHLYGILSDQAHMHLPQQYRYVDLGTDRINVTVRFGSEHLEEVDVLFPLADTYAMLAEYLIREVLSEFTTIEDVNGNWVPVPSRPFLRILSDFYKAYPE
jgi:hypothetical protein